MKDCKKRHTNLGMAWIDYRKAYGMIPHSWILESLKMVNVADIVIEMLKRSMNSWNVNLTSSGDFLGNVNIKRGIFKGDSLSPLLIVICMIPLSRLLRKVKVCYTLKNGKRLNHLIFMGNLKLFGKNENVNSLVSTVQVFSDDIKKEFGVKKCGILIMHRGALAKTKRNGIMLPSEETIKHINEDGYKYLGILEFDSVKEKEMKEAFATEYFRRVKLVLKSKLNGKNKINALNTWAISLMRYGAGILNWRVNELDQVDRKTRKILTINREFHPKSDIDRLYVSRKKGGRGLISCKNCIASEENNLGWSVKSKVEPLLIAVKIQRTIKTDGVIEPKEFKKRDKERVYNAWKEKRMYGKYLRDMDRKDLQNSWEWLRSSDLKGCTEALICSAQEQTLRTNNIKHFVDKSQDSPLCRMCDQRNETVFHIVSECTVLAQKEYLERHNNVY